MARCIIFWEGLGEALSDVNDAVNYDCPFIHGKSAIDVHVHVWTDDTGHYPLAKGYQPEDMKPKRITPEDLFKHNKPAGYGKMFAAVARNNQVLCLLADPF
jgi:hypothetical protein